MARVREVQSPDGRVWRVRRRWLPKTPRLRKRLSTRREGDSFTDLFSIWDVAWLDDLVGAVIGVVVFVVIVLVLVTLVFPLIALTLELLLLVVLFTAGAIGRLVFGRPWRIEATTIGAPRRTREVHAKGLRGSKEAIDDLAAEIASGR
ncbi:MAG TPA: hypothetical protein VE570_00060 [Thermoleophilaceae bacterium]|nr:hypothetical protein [Thermoleophilaceae bacterium]